MMRYEQFFLQKSRVFLYITTFILLILFGFFEGKKFVSVDGGTTTNISVGNPMHILLFGYFFSWLWVLGYSLNEKIPEEQRFPLRVLKKTFVVLFFSFLACSLYGYFLFDHIVGNTMLLILLVVWGVTNSIVYLWCIWSVIKIINHFFNRSISKGVFAALLSIVLLPFTIWKLQPSIQEIFNEEVK
jgi:hypothetical protein